MSKFYPVLFFTTLSFAISSGDVFACDKANKSKHNTSRSVSIDSCDDSQSIIERLERLLVPVAEKNHECSEELNTARIRIQELESDLANAESTATKSMRLLVAFKSILADKSCTICIGGQTFTREAVGKALAVQVNHYKTANADVARLSEELTHQKELVREVEDRVARWRDAETKLLAEVAQLQTLHSKSIGTNSAKVSEEKTQHATQVAGAVEKLLVKSGPAVSTTETKVLEEVDAILSTEIEELR